MLLTPFDRIWIGEWQIEKRIWRHILVSGNRKVLRGAGNISSTKALEKLCKNIKLTGQNLKGVELVYLNNTAEIEEMA